MPRNQFQRMVFAFLTVLITVHAYVFYSLYVVNGQTLMNITGADSVLSAIRAQGGVLCPSDLPAGSLIPVRPIPWFLKVQSLMPRWALCVRS